MEQKDVADEIVSVLGQVNDDCGSSPVLVRRIILQQSPDNPGIIRRLLEDDPPDEDGRASAVVVDLAENAYYLIRDIFLFHVMDMAQRWLASRPKLTVDRKSVV